MISVPAMAMLLQSACWDGTMGEGALARRVVLEERDSSRVSLTLFARQQQLVAMQRRGVGNTLSASSVDDGGALRVALSPVRTTAGRDEDDLPPLERTGWLFTGRDSLRLVLRPARPIDERHWSLGDWNGILSSDGLPLRVGFRLSRGPCGVLVGTLDSPDQPQRDTPFSAGTVTLNTARVEIGFMRLAITIARGLDAEQATARLEQGDRSNVIVVKRGDVRFAVRRPQEPAPPLPYDTIAVTIGDTAKGGVRLAGTLTMPSGSGPAPAIVLIGGAGAFDRDGSIAGHRPFLVLADKLTREGWAVLRLDGRGVGKSSGVLLQATMNDLANDVLTAATWLRRWPGIDSTRVALLSHGEGGYLAPMVATRASWIRTIVMLAAPAVSGRVLLAQQRAASARSEGATPLQASADSALTRAIADAIASRQSAIPVDSAVTRAIRTVRRSVSVQMRRSIDEMLASRTAAEDSAAYAFWSTPWFTSFVRHEPDSTLRALQVPVLALYGMLDVQVPSVVNGTLLHDALEDLTNEEAQKGSLVALLPRINHLMQTSDTGRAFEYSEIDETIATVVIDAILKFLSGRR